MSAKKGVTTGLIIAVLAGLAGAGGAHALANRVELPSEARPAAVNAPQRLTVTAAAGAVKAYTPDGELQKVMTGMALARPTGLVTKGLDAMAALSFGKTRIVASRDARVMFNAPGRPLRMYVEAGRVIVSSAISETVVPGRSIRIAGSSYGVWVQADRVLVAVLDDKATVYRSGKPTEYARGREVVLNKDTSNFAVFPPKLTVYVDRADARDGLYSIRGKTSPNAEVMVRKGDSYRRIPVALSGVFSTEIIAAQPAAGELVAFDSAGRRAEVSKPSRTLDELFMDLSGSARGSETSEPEMAPKTKAAEPAKPEVAEPESAKPVVAEPAPKVGKKPAVKAAPPPPPKPAARSAPKPAPVKAARKKRRRTPKKRTRAKVKKKKKAVKATPKPKPAPKPAEEEVELEWD